MGAESLIIMAVGTALSAAMSMQQQSQTKKAYQRHNQMIQQQQEEAARKRREGTAVDDELGRQAEEARSKRIELQSNQFNRTSSAISFGGSTREGIQIEGQQDAAQRKETA